MGAILPSLSLPASLLNNTLIYSCVKYSTLYHLSMKIRIFIGAFIVSGIAFGQSKSIEVQGNAPLLVNTPVALTQFADYITQTEITVASQTIGADGKFWFNIPNLPSGEYMLHIGTQSHSLLLQPGHLYNLEIPDPAGEEVYYPTESDTTLLLYQASNLDYQINFFSIYNYEDFANGRIKPKLKKFIDSMEVKYGYIKDSFFVQYKEYKMAVLMSNANYKSRRTFYQTLLKGRPILYSHPQYMAYFNEFYTGFMNELIKSAAGDQIKNAVVAGTPVDSILATIRKTDLGDDPDLAELICMKGLFELYYQPGYDKYKLESLVIELRDRSKKKEIKKIGDNFLSIIQKLKPGKDHISFEGKDTEGNIHPFSEYTGKNVFLTFFSTDDAASIREMIAIKNLYDEYRKDINFVSVCSSCSYSSLQAFINENKLKWTFLIVDPGVEGAYEVISYPSAFFIDKEGKFVWSPSPMPSAGVSNQIYLFLKEQKKKTR